MSGGTYNGAVKVGTIQFVENKNPYILSDLEIAGSAVEIQGGASYLVLAEVEVYTSLLGESCQNNATGSLMCGNLKEIKMPWIKKRVLNHYTPHP